MQSFFIAAIVLLIIAFFSDRQRKNKNDLLFKGYLRTICLAFVLLVPYFLINSLIPEYKPLSGDRWVKIANLSSAKERWPQKLKGYRLRVKEDPSLTHIFEYFDEHNSQYIRHFSPLIQYVESLPINQANKNIALAYIDYLYDRNVADLESRLLHDNFEPGSYFIRGLVSWRLGKLDTAYFHFQKELSLDVVNELNVPAMQSFISLHFPDSLEALMTHKTAVDYINPYSKRLYYYEEGFFAYYFKELVINPFKSIERLPFIIAIIVSLLWIYFIWMIDIFRPEKWLVMLAVFATSWIGSNFCLFFYDSFHAMGFELGHNWFEDLAYNVIVIGGSEEAIKLLPWLSIALFTNIMKEPYDYILYACVSALGFAGAENFQYYDFYDMSLIVRRALLCCVTHMFDASIVAYFIVLMKYRYKDWKWRKFLPVLGFLLAMLAHGLYDFWLISEFTDGFWFLSYLMFGISLHLWLVMKQNASNHSPFFTLDKKIDNSLLSFVLIISLILTLHLEYFALSYTYGTKPIEAIFNSSAMFIVIFGTYFTLHLDTFKMRQGKWINFGITQPSGGLSLIGAHGTPETHVFRFFASKSNKYVGNSFPITGEYLFEVEIDSVEGWYLILLNKPIRIVNDSYSRVAVRPKNMEDSLDDDKIEIIMLLVDERVNFLDKAYKTSDFLYVGPTFSRPIE